MLNRFSCFTEQKTTVVCSDQPAVCWQESDDTIHITIQGLKVVYVPGCPGPFGGVIFERDAADGGAGCGGMVQEHSQGLRQGSGAQCLPKQREG